MTICPEDSDWNWWLKLPDETRKAAVKGFRCLADPQRTQPAIIATVRGNCGVIHTFEEWKNCRACDTPQPLVPWWNIEVMK